jgi:hypothetical protein
MVMNASVGPGALVTVVWVTGPSVPAGRHPDAVLELHLELVVHLVVERPLEEDAGPPHVSPVLELAGAAAVQLQPSRAL